MESGIIVPYNQVINIEIVQGSISTRLGLGTLLIKTAGFHLAGGGATTWSRQGRGHHGYERL
ncbi:MAG: PH domain-containing protein [Nitrososphaerales archaeon]